MPYYHGTTRERFMVIMDRGLVAASEITDETWVYFTDKISDAFFFAAFQHEDPNDEYVVVEIDAGFASVDQIDRSSRYIGQREMLVLSYRGGITPGFLREVDCRVIPESQRPDPFRDWSKWDPSSFPTK